MVLIRGGRIIDPANQRDEIVDVLIQGSKITRMGLNLDAKGSQIIDAKGKIISPGFIDVHTHLREPGFEYKETIRDGMAAAAAGGFTGICCMANTFPVNDSQSITELILKKARANGKVHVYPIGAVTKGLEGKELSEMGELMEAGCVGFSDDGKPIINAQVMRRALEYSKAFDMPIIAHCEDEDLFGEGVMNEGGVATSLGLQGIPNACEETMVARDIILAELTGGRLHIAHASTAGSVDLIRRAKAKGIRVTAEVAPHHFILTDEAVREYQTHAKMNPPLRFPKDVEALKEGLKDGTIDMIATDHAPHANEEKETEFDLAPFGVIGMETALPLSLKLVEEGLLSWNELIQKLSSNPSVAFNLPGGRLEEGGEADLVLIDPEAFWVIRKSEFFSKGRNCPFDGWRVKGRVEMTFIGGEVVFQQKGWPSLNRETV
ncbi:MAG TPA: dihydroorotase [Nitrospiria bacterium]|jgi:dihydroorotase